MGGDVVGLFRPRKTSAKSSLELRVLGRTGLKVTPVGCGATRTMEPAVIKVCQEFKSLPVNIPKWMKL